MKITREEIHSLGGNSNISPENCQKLLTREVYNSPIEWKKFLKIVLLTFGIGFFLSGVIFFFAYNWDDLNKFVKLILTQSLIPIGIFVYIFFKGHPVIRELGAITATVMVGVSYAVYGQIYQTGANDFDFFFNWSLMVMIWVVFTNSLANWLIYIALLNTTLITYSQQYAFDWTFDKLYGYLFFLNASLLIVFLLVSKKTNLFKAPNWFTIPIALLAAYYSTIGISSGIHSTKSNEVFAVFLLLTIVIYALGIYIGYINKRLFYLGTIYFSCIIIICSFILYLSRPSGQETLLLLSLIVIGSITLIVTHFLNLQKKWKNESSE